MDAAALPSVPARTQRVVSSFKVPLCLSVAGSRRGLQLDIWGDSAPGNSEWRRRAGPTTYDLVPAERASYLDLFQDVGTTDTD
jgi:hypothetical protein